MGGQHRLSTTHTVSDLVNRLGEADGCSVPILVDIPRDRAKSMKDLRFFEENDHWKHSTDEYENIATGRSRMWNKMADIFTGAAGKIRMFAHPSIAEIMRSVAQSRLEEALVNALSTVES
jgi:hypothetical protein